MDSLFFQALKIYYPPPQSNKHPYKVEITEVTDENQDGRIDLADVEYLMRNKKNTMTLLDGDGDFRSHECVELLKQADIICTNPPFSLFREYVAQLVKHDKKFVIIGNQNAITYKEIFPLIAENKLWLGVPFNNGNAYFAIPAENQPAYAKGVYNPETGLVKFRNVCWFTNLDIPKRHEDLILYKHYTPEEYPKYDNYDAINVDKTADIPCDYDGVMGVPITFLDKYNPDQFEIVAFRKGNDGKDLVYSFDEHSQNSNVERERERERERDGRYSLTSEYLSDENRYNARRCDTSDTNGQKALPQNHYTFATAIPGMIKNAEGKIGKKITYARITIRKKQGEKQ